MRVEARNELGFFRASASRFDALRLLKALSLSMGASPVSLGSFPDLRQHLSR